MKNLNDLSKEELIVLLQSANKKLKRAELIAKKLRKQVRKFRRLQEFLSGISFYYVDKYDDMSDLEFGKLRGRVELKDELMTLINADK